MQKADPDDEDLGPGAPVTVRWPIEITKAEFTVFELHRRWKQGHLELGPDFQREFVWSREKQIKLVESVMARIPLPVFYLSDEEEDTILVVDGQQRLTTLFAFMDGFFPGDEGREPVPFVLRDLRLAKELDNKEFATLDARLRRRFEETPLVCFMIRPGTEAEVKFELFERINQGATPLNAQEIRNALYRGPGLTMIRELAGSGGPFRRAAGDHRTYKRMRADEFVLRAVAFLWRGSDDYRGDLKGFLNDTLKLLNKQPEHVLEELRRRVEHSIRFAQQVFGEHAWQRFDPETEEWSGHVSGPLVEVVSTMADRVFGWGLPTPEQAISIERGFRELCGDPKFVSAVLSATQTTNNVHARMKAFEQVCRAV